MRRIRILIVDDAVTVRRLMSDVLSSDPSLEVVGTAASGRIALAKIPQVKPDILTLDVEMPDMDGLQTLAAIREAHPDLPVVMFSNLTRRGAEATLDALYLGARDYVFKPAGFACAADAVQSLRDELIPRIKTFCASVAGIEPPMPSRRAARSVPAAPGPRRVEVVAIGVSTGGPNALAALLPKLPARFPFPLLIVQHMPALFTELLAGRLAQQCQIRVCEGRATQPLLPGHAYIAPGDHHMLVERNGIGSRLRLTQGPPENSCRPSVDVLFRSVAEVYGRNTLAIVMTGMGQDGLKGCQKIRDEGGEILVQDEATSVVWGMPGFVARAGLADAVVPLPGLASEILRRALRSAAPADDPAGARSGAVGAAGTT